MKIQGYGWVRDLPDHRDVIYSAPMATLRALPPSVDLRPSALSPVYDQGHLGCCTANAIAAALQFDEIKQKKNGHFIPSRLFIYYNERVIEGTVKSDSGAQLRDGVKAVVKARDLRRERVAIQYPQVRRKAPYVSLQRRGPGQSHPLPSPDATGEPVEGLSCERLPLRLRLYRVREL
jgi:hypothetical protein